ncbi:MAG: endolytic transglycosylase MltG [Acidimicrobiales bacterium]
MTDPRLFDQDTATEPRDTPAAGDEPRSEGPLVGASRPPDAYPPPDEPVVHPGAGSGPPLDAREYVRIGEPPGPVRKVLLTTLGVLIILGVLVGGASMWIQRQIDPPGGPGDALSITIPSGSTVDGIASQLAEEGVVANPTVFRYYLRWKGIDSFQAGEYTLMENSAFGDVIDALAAGPAPPETDRFTVPEGLTLDEITELLDEEVPGFDADEVSGALIRMETPWRPGNIDSWEGLLFPDTYEYNTNDSTQEILQRMKDQFDEVARSVGLDPWMNIDPDTLATTGLTAYDHIIIASMIEEEARLSEEHAMMSRVIHNRLALGMNLGIDATVLYARGPDREGPLTDADLAIDSPYNTRLNPGLPPTPIAAPSRSALDAALHPAEGPWLYYVLADEDGSHFFTDDYDEFLRVRDESRAAGLF